MRSIEIFVKISRFLIVCYFVHSVSLASTEGSTERICPDNIPGPWKWTLHDELCVLSGPDPLSWEGASSFCRSRSSDLLIFDDNILKKKFNVSDPISRKTFLELFNGTAGNDTWIGLHSVKKKLWWEYDVPVRVMREPLSSVYTWSAGQPDRNHGLCGVIQAIYLPNGTSNYTLKLSMSKCESPKSFVCFRKSIDLTVPPTMLNVSSLCPKDWFGNVDSTFCYQFGAKKGFDDSLSSCRMLGGTLMYPKSELEFYFVKAVIARTIVGLGQDNYWVGLYGNDTTADGESWRNWTYLQSSKNSEFTTGCVYLRKANDSFQLWTVNCTDTSNTVVQVCQIALNSSTNPKPNVTADNNINITRQNFSNTSLSLTCNVGEDYYHPTKSVVWVKDGIYLDNGLPPHGLTLMLDPVNLSQKLDVHNFRFNSTLQGTYYCEVWGVAKERMELNQTRLTFIDVGTFRGTMSTPANWSMSLPPIAAETFWLANQTSGPNNTLTGLFDSYNIQIQFDGIQCTVLNTTCSDVQIDFTLYYLYEIDGKWLDELLNYISSSTLPPDFKGVAWQWFFNEKIYQYLNNSIQNVNAKVTIRRTDGCAMETMKYQDVVLHFQSASFNQSMGSAEVCMTGDVNDPPSNQPGDHDHPPPPRSVAVGTCLGNFLDGGSWNLTDSELSCLEPQKPYTPALWDYTKTLLSPNTVLNVTQEVKGLTEGSLYAFDITSVAMILNNVAMVPNLPQEVAENFLHIVENVLGVDKDSVLREAHTMPGNAPFRITNALEMLASNIQLNNSTNFTFKSSNLSFAFRVESTKSSNSSIGFGSRMSEYQPMYEYHEIDEFDTAITWSDNVTRLRDFLGTIFNDGVRTTYIIYENTGLFNNLSNVQSSSPNNTVHDSNGMDSHPVVKPSPPQNTNMDSHPKDFKQSNDKIRINSKVVSGMINGFPLRGLKNDSIKIIFKLNQKLGTNEQCAFVDHADPSGDSPEWGWSFLGLINKTPDKEMMSLQCYSSHLTNFASILNIDIDLPTSPVLGIISTVGLVISIIGLAITLLSQIFIRKLRQSVSQLTIFNLALALLAVDIIVLAGIEPNPSYPAACLAVACLLHYFLLVAFSWMLIEAVVRYVKFTRHFRPDPFRFVRRVALPAWLLPAVVVAISAGLDNRHLTEPRKMCWLSPEVFHFGFLLPLSMIMLINLILFVLIVKLICCCRTQIRSNQSPNKILWRQTQASINTFIVVGLTWLFAFFAIDGTSGSKTAMAYLFCIFNCFQGFFIFVLICLANKDFRKMVSEWFSSESKKKPTNDKRKPPENVINRFRKGTLDKGTTSLQQVQQFPNGEYGTNSLSNESCRTVSTSDGYSYGIGDNGYPDVVVCPDTIELNEITSSGIAGSMRDVDDKSDVCTVASYDTNSTTDSVDDHDTRIAKMNGVREETEMERAPSIFVENTNDILRFC